MKYRGHRDITGKCFIEVIADQTEIGRPLAHRVRHSPDGFEWGYEGSGPADTARSLLAEHLGYVPCMAVYQRFKRKVVAVMPPTWELEEATLVHHLAAILVDLGMHCPRCGDSGIVADESMYCTCEEGQAAAAETV